MPATVPPSRRMDATRPGLIDHILDAQAANDTQHQLAYQPATAEPDSLIEHLDQAARALTANNHAAARRHIRSARTYALQIVRVNRHERSFERRAAAEADARLAGMTLHQLAAHVAQLLDRDDLAGLHTVFAAVPTDRLFSARTVHKLARARTSRLFAIHAEWRTKHDGTGA